MVRMPKVTREDFLDVAFTAVTIFSPITSPFFEECMHFHEGLKVVYDYYHYQIILRVTFSNQKR
jgi:hypothetical protein